MRLYAVSYWDDGKTVKGWRTPVDGEALHDGEVLTDQYPSDPQPDPHATHAEANAGGAP